MKKIMNPGVYPGISFPDYQAIDAVNQSALKDARSPAHIFEALYGEPKPPSAEMVLGQALHATILEKLTGVSHIIDGPINEKTGNGYGAGTKAYAEFCAAHPGKIVLARDDRTKLDMMSERVLGHSRARKLIESKGLTEITMVWEEPVTLPDGTETVVRMKGRMDRVIPGVCCFDLKTCSDASPESWAWAVRDWGYHIQDNVYERGRKALKIDGGPFGFLCVENKAPHCVEIYEIDSAPAWPDGPTTKDVAKWHVDRALAMVAACQKAKFWPGYAETKEIRRVGLPYSELRRFEEARQAEGDLK